MPRLAAVIVTGFAVGVLSACAAAVPGYMPEGSRQSALTRLKSDPGTMGSAGDYQLSGTEQALDCKRLNGSMQIIVSRLKASGDRPTPSAASQTLRGAAGAVGIKNTSLDLPAELRRERARLEAYNRQLAAKGCKTMDIDAALAG